jgi:hypothetical protein
MQIQSERMNSNDWKDKDKNEVVRLRNIKQLVGDVFNSFGLLFKEIE